MSQEQSSAFFQNQKPWLVWACVGCSVLMAAMDGTMVSLALPNIARALQSSLPDTQWVMLAYMLSIAVLLLPIGKLGEQFGTRRLFTLGLFVYSLFAVACGFAPNVETLIILRVTQGIGSSLYMAMGAVLLSKAFGRELGKPMSGIHVIVATAAIIGPLVTGLILEHFDWPLLFWLSVPISTGGILLALLVLKPFQEYSEPHCQPFDFAGSVASMLALGGFLYLFTYGVKQPDAWLINLPVLGVSGLSGIWFFAHIRAAVNPILSLQVFRSKTVQTTCLSSALVFSLTSVMTFLLPFYLTGSMGKELSQTMLGYMMVLFPLGLAITAPVSGILSDRFGSKTLSILGILGIIMAGGLMLFYGSQTPLWLIALQQFTFGLASGLFHTPNNRAMILAFESIGAGTVAGSMLTLMRTLGQALGITILGLCFLLVGSELFANTAAFYAAFSASVVATVVFLCMGVLAQWHLACDEL